MLVKFGKQERPRKVYVDEATRMRRMHARAKGRGCRILKRTCHINVVVSDGKGN